MPNFQLEKNIPLPLEEEILKQTSGYDPTVRKAYRKHITRRRINTDLRQQIISFIIRNPGLSKTVCAERMGINQSNFAFVSTQLIAEGVLLYKEEGNRHLLWFFDKEVRYEEHSREEKEIVPKKIDGRTKKRGPRGPHKKTISLIPKSLVPEKKSLWQRLTGGK